MAQLFDELRGSFDTVASVYDATRQGYVEALFDDLVSASALSPDDTVLEIGCATGQATRGFAERGFRVLAIDPGEALIELARRNFSAYPKIAFAVSRFEDLPPQRGAFRLVAAAQSWHWVPAEISFAKAEEALAPGGYLAVWGHVPVGIAPAPLLAAFEAIHREHIGHWGPPPEAGYLPNGPFAGLFDRSGRFGPVTHRSYPWRQTLDTAGFLAVQNSKSYYQVLPAPQRDALFAALAEAIDAQGGRCELQHETHLYFARRKS